ncbi:T-cell surface glycoprotein CD8 beta chain isoform 1-T1 [Ammospiza maritima maritima]
MAWPWLHLCICLQIPGFYTTLLLAQTPGHILTQTSNKTEILCDLKKEHTGVYWYRWSQERQQFQFLLFSNTMGRATYGPGVSQDKFSVHEARSQSSYSLHISHLQPSDSGIYYCSAFQSSQLLLGTGTQLSVVDVLPPKTTQTPVSKKPPPRTTKRKAASREGMALCQLLEKRALLSSWVLRAQLGLSWGGATTGSPCRSGCLGAHGHTALDRLLPLGGIPWHIHRFRGRMDFSLGSHDLRVKFPAVPFSL